MTRQDELRLIERAAAGDREAAGAFIKAHQRSLYAYILRLSGRSDVAEDIVQEAFVRVLTNLDRFDPRFRFSTWLFTIAKRLYVNARQKHAPVFNSEIVGGFGGADRGVGERAGAAGLAGREAHANVRDALQAALMQLPELQREIVVLFHQLDWPIAVIAEHLDMPEGTIKSHLHRSRKRLRQILESSERHTRDVQEAWR